jgi:hypothetical protein
VGAHRGLDGPRVLHVPLDYAQAQQFKLCAHVGDREGKCPSLLTFQVVRAPPPEPSRYGSENFATGLTT